MYSIPTPEALKIVSVIDKIVDNSDEKFLLNDLLDIIEDNDSYNSWSPELWKEVEQYLIGKNKLEKSC
jgi:hypothetical protein